jgi:hypothetical protein
MRRQIELDCGSVAVAATLEAIRRWKGSPFPAERSNLARAIRADPPAMRAPELHLFRKDIWIADGPRVRFAPAWATDLEQMIFKGNALVEEVEFFNRPSRTLIVTDLIQNYRAEADDLMGNALKTIGGVLGGGVPLDIQLSFTARNVAPLPYEVAGVAV